MSACQVTGHARGGKTVLNCRVNNTLSQGSTCDQLRQVEPLASLVLRCEPSQSLIEGNRDYEIEALQAFIEAPWMLLQAVLGMAQHAELKVVLELPSPTTPLTKSINAFWSSWLESRDLSNSASPKAVELRFLSES